MLKIAWKKSYNHDLPEGHRFPMIKYDLIPEQLLYEGTIGKDNLFEPCNFDESILEWTHCMRYVDNLKQLKIPYKEQRKSGFPHSLELIQREFDITEGTRKCAEYAIEFGIAMNVAGGTHHAFRDAGEGFCLLNDQVVSANYLLQNNIVKQVLIIDLDVHQGNGTAKLCEGNNQVFTFSVHGEHNYPMHKEKSDLDVGVPDRINDEDYLKIIRERIPELIDKVQPDFVFYQCGVDILSTDKLGRLNVSIEGCKERDRIVLEECKKNELPIVCTMGGGYSKEIKHIVEAHSNTFRLAQDLFF